jgi:hypothetical protein
LFGIQIAVPSHWTAYLPQDVQLLSLSVDSVKSATISMYAQKTTLDQLREGWRAGKELAPGISILPEENLISTDSLVYAKLRLTNDKSVKGFGLAACSEFGVCYTILLAAPVNKRDRYESLLPALANQITFKAPSVSGINDLYDWKQELTGKYLVLYEPSAQSVKRNHLWLCNDGSFRANIQRKGLIKKEAGNYRGKQKGTYTLEGIGEAGELTLSFKNLEEFRIQLEIKGNNEVYLDGKRYFIGKNERCN